MDIVETLIVALKHAGGSDWAEAALSALEQSPARFSGQSANNSGSPAAEFIRIYELRLDQCRKHDVPCAGIESLLETLRTANESARFHIRPFVTATHTLAAFYDAGQRLIGCVTIRHVQRTVCGALQISF